MRYLWVGLYIAILNRKRFFTLKTVRDLHWRRKETINFVCNNNITQYDVYSAIIYIAKRYARVHFGSSERKSFSSTFESGCRLL